MQERLRARHPGLCGQGTQDYAGKAPTATVGETLYGHKGSESRAERNGEGYSVEQVLGIRKASDITGARGCASCTSKGTPVGGQRRVVWAEHRGRMSCAATGEV